VRRSYEPWSRGFVGAKVLSADLAGQRELRCVAEVSQLLGGF